MPFVPFFAICPFELVVFDAWNPMESHIFELQRLANVLVKAIQEEEPVKQVRLIIGGLMGSGKSTICRMLRHLLQGRLCEKTSFKSQAQSVSNSFEVLQKIETSVVARNMGQSR